jgi:hypothetical protein
LVEVGVGLGLSTQARPAVMNSPIKSKTVMHRFRKRLNGFKGFMYGPQSEQAFADEQAWTSDACDRPVRTSATKKDYSHKKNIHFYFFKKKGGHPSSGA